MHNLFADTAFDVALIGLLLFAIFTRPKFTDATCSEIGRILFFCGTLAFLLGK